MRKYTYEMFETKCKEIAKEILKRKEIKYIIGIKRGGWIPAVRISHLTGLPILNEGDDYINTNEVAIIDEILDSGRTRNKYLEYKHFFVLVDKQLENITDWVEFFWEEK